MSAVALACFATFAAGCDSSGDDPPVPDVTAAEAYTAIVRWEISERPPIADESGNVKLPVVYLSADSGSTVDVGVQAEVVVATADDAVVRFSDDSTDSLDDGLPGTPVIDDGVMFVVGDIEAGEAVVQAPARRYRSVDDDVTLRFEIVASDEGAIVTAATELTNVLD